MPRPLSRTRKPSPRRAILSSVLRGLALVSASVLVAGCGRIGYPALDERDGGTANAMDSGTPMDAPSDLDAPPIPDSALPDRAAALDSTTHIDAPVDGSSMSDAGVAPDAPMVDGGPVGAGCGPAAVFCDGFEGATLVPPWGGTIVDPGTFLGRSTGTFYSGAGALEADVLGETRSAFVYAPIDPPLASGEVYVRGYFRFETTTLQHFDFLQVSASAGGIGPLVYGGEIRVFNEFDPGTELLSATPYTVPLGRFLCIEMRVAFHETAGVVDVWVDGAPVLHAEGTPTFTASQPVMQARAGASWAGPGQPSATVYVDDVVVSTARIGCL